MRMCLVSSSPATPPPTVPLGKGGRRDRLPTFQAELEVALQNHSVKKKKLTANL